MYLFFSGRSILTWLKLVNIFIRAINVISTKIDPFNVSILYSIPIGGGHPPSLYCIIPWEITLYRVIIEDIKEMVIARIVRGRHRRYPPNGVPLQKNAHTSGVITIKMGTN